MIRTFLESIYVRSVESYETKSGGPLRVFFISIGDTIGITAVVEAKTNKSTLSGTPLNLDEEDRWEKGIGGGLQFLLTARVFGQLSKGKLQQRTLPPQSRGCARSPCTRPGRQAHPARPRHRTDPCARILRADTPPHPSQPPSLPRPHRPQRHPFPPPNPRRQRLRPKPKQRRLAPRALATPSLDERIAAAEAQLNPARQRTLEYQAQRRAAGLSLKGGPSKGSGTPRRTSGS